MIEIPGYRIIRTLGKGGMASVYLAIQENFEREVALKVMSASLSGDDKFTERFLREAKIVSQLVHPNIVTVYDVGVKGSLHFLSMEYIPGMDLKQKRKSLTLTQCLQAIKDVAKALDYAGKKGYVHRDVKPENIMLHEDDGRAVLMDFGIACMSDATSGMTQTGTAIGTPHYMSPEQAKGRPVDARSDIYSLGVVLFLLVAGHVPYDADSAVAVGIKHVSENIPLLPKNLALLQPIIDKVLAKEPGERFQSGVELSAAIEQITAEDIAAIESLALRHITNAIDTRDTESPTLVSASVAAVHFAANPARANPDRTTVSTEALPTSAVLQTSTGQTKYVTAESKALNVDHTAIANRVTTRSGSFNADEVRAITGSGLRAKRTPPPMNKNRTRTSGRVSAVSATEEIVSIAAEDRRELKAAAGRSWLWLAVLLILVGGASGAVYFKSKLQQPYSGYVDMAIDQTLQWRDDLYYAVGQMPPPRENQTLTQQPIVVVEPDITLAEQKSLQQATLDDLSQYPNQQTITSTPGSTLSPAVATTTDEMAETDENGLTDARSLRDELDSDLSVAPELAQLYRDVLAKNPEDKKAEWGLKELKDYHFRYMRDGLAKRDLAKTKTYIDSIHTSFPNVAEDEKYQQLMGRYDSAQKAQVFVDAGQVLLEAKKLTSPQDDNALQAFNHALVLDPGNPLAEAGISQIVQQYQELATERVAAGEWNSALEMISRGLAIDSNDKALAKMQQQVSLQVDRQRQMEILLAAAENQIARDELITPRGESAYSKYQAVLAMDSDNAQARRGQVKIEQLLAQRIEAAINRTDFSGAGKELQAAREVFTNSERLLALAVSLEAAIDADFIARQPKISDVLVSNHLPDSIAEQQADTLNVDRTIYIGFQYDNLNSETNIVNAVLYDGSRSIEIAQVPVIVSGKNGVKFFSIDRPVEGFAEGGYTIDLLLGTDRLSTLAFKVESSRATE